MTAKTDGRIVVFGYSEVGYSCLKLLLDQGRNMVALFTHEDDGAETQWFRSCAKLGRDRGIPVYTMEPKDPALEAALIEAKPDLILSLYYRKMLPMRLLERAKLGAFNLHGSLLPRYRGRAPLNWAIINGEKETGITLHVMEAKADAGDMIDQEAVAIGPEETAGEVAPRVAEAAVKLLARQIDGLLDGTAPRIKQDESQVTYFGARKAEDGKIDWSKTARNVVDLVRAVAPPFPGAFTELRGSRFMVWKARVAPGAGAVEEVLSLVPFVVAAEEGAVELLHFGFPGENENAASTKVIEAMKAARS